MIVMERAEPEQPAAFPFGGGAKQRGSHGGQVDAILDGGPVETFQRGVSCYRGRRRFRRFRQNGVRNGGFVGNVGNAARS